MLVFASRLKGRQETGRRVPLRMGVRLKWNKSSKKSGMGIFGHLSGSQCISRAFPSTPAPRWAFQVTWVVHRCAPEERPSGPVPVTWTLPSSEEVAQPAPLPLGEVAQPALLPLEEAAQPINSPTRLSLSRGSSPANPAAPWRSSQPAPPERLDGCRAGSGLTKPGRERLGGCRAGSGLMLLSWGRLGGCGAGGSLTAAEPGAA